MDKRNRGHRPDPYMNFVDDDQRRRALNTKVRWTCAAAIAVAMVSGERVAAALAWLAKYVA